MLAKYDITPYTVVKGKKYYNHISKTGCLIPGSRIFTVDGYRNIEDIEVGDYVNGCFVIAKQTMNDKFLLIIKTIEEIYTIFRLQ